MEKIIVNDNFEIILPKKIINKLDIKNNDILIVDYLNKEMATISKKTIQ